MVSSVLGQTRHAGFPSGAWSDRIDGLPASLEAVRGVRFDPDDAGSKAQADSGASAGGGAPVYRISKALLNKVPPSWTAWRHAACHNLPCLLRCCRVSQRVVHSSLRATNIFCSDEIFRTKRECKDIVMAQPGRLSTLADRF